MKPILFNTEMVRAILDGRKTVTRRLVKDKDIINQWDCESDGTPIAYIEQLTGDHYPPTTPCRYRSGDILYVRETWTTLLGSYLYKAAQKPGMKNPGKWHPSIHMPKEAARLFLRVKDVRVERLQDMTEDDVCEEGAEPLIRCPLEHPAYGPDGTLGDMCWNTDCCGKCEYIEKSYGELFGEFIWNRTIKKANLPRYGWAANPWVWVIEFERISKEAAQKGENNA